MRWWGIGDLDGLYLGCPPDHYNAREHDPTFGNASERLEMKLTN
jgi:hypothetical protein